ncbi:helix-turn-helix domain-containing protein [Sphingomonas qilianensis]|uniref:helix-turn-helix domain-containing protein n=1 Tax=Sphingomonas qilianensis TaxID=1736690 RepID=UPI00361B8BA9
MSEPIAYSVKDAAAACGLSRTTLYQLIKAGRITPRKFGARTILLRSDLEAMLAHAATA